MHKFLIALLFVLALTLAVPEEDEILEGELPGLTDPITFKQYSGYLNATETRHLHYWFVESKNDNLTDPLLLWLNGGPGCSSLLGLLTELGPFYLKDNETVALRQYSWNENANVLFLESPACVGFSYDDNNECSTNDDKTAEENYNALKDFFVKFEEYKDHDFYITGESYAGMYIPALSVKILEGMDTYPMNFQGYAIGNGLLSFSMNTNSLFFFARYHAIIDDQLWGKMVDYCCDDDIESPYSCKFFLTLRPNCNEAVLLALLKTYYGGMNVYNMYGDCDESTARLTGSTTRDEFETEFLSDIFDIDVELPSSTPCLNNDIEVSYLNRDDVKEALHIPADWEGEWDVCVRLGYRRSLDSTGKIDQLAKAGIRGLIYNGDVDMACNFIGNQWEVESLNLEVIEDHRSWMSGGQIAGYVKKFKNLDFLTIKGSGHMVPEDKPMQAFDMITSFLNNEDYTRNPKDDGCIMPASVSTSTGKIENRFAEFWEKLSEGFARPRNSFNYDKKNIACPTSFK